MPRLLLRLFFHLALVFSLPFTGMVWASTITEDLVAHWDFNGTGNDLTGNNHQGTLYGDATYISTQFGQSLYLDGDGDYFTTPDAHDLDFTDSFTISMWINPASVESAFQGLIGKWSHLVMDPHASFEFFLQSDTIFSTLCFAKSYWMDTETQSIVQANQWQQIAWRLDNDYLSIFFNGTSIYKKEVYGDSIQNSSYPLVIGAANFHSNSYFKGYIDEVKLWGKALSDDQIQDDYNNGGSNPVPEPSTMLLLGAGLIGLSRLLRKKQI